MSRKQKWFSWGAFILVVSTVLVYIPCIFEPRDYSIKIRSANDLKIVGVTLYEYLRVNGRFPPAVVRDAEGKPLYSWRVLILPILGEDELYKQFHLDEPWDSPHNLPLSRKRCRAFDSVHNGEKDAGLTRFQVLVGPGTAFERDGLTLGDFPDGTENTILVVESGTGVPWSKPEDVVYDPAKPLPPFGQGFKRAVKFMCYNLDYKPGFYVCFVDGSVQFIDQDTDEQVIRSMITRDGSGKVSTADLKSYSREAGHRDGCGCHE